MGCHLPGTEHPHVLSHRERTGECRYPTVPRSCGGPHTVTPPRFQPQPPSTPRPSPSSARRPNKVGMTEVGRGMLSLRGDLCLSFPGESWLGEGCWGMRNGAPCLGHTLSPSQKDAMQLSGQDGTDGKRQDEQLSMMGGSQLPTTPTATPETSTSRSQKSMALSGHRGAEDTPLSGGTGLCPQLGRVGRGSGVWAGLWGQHWLLGQPVPVVELEGAGGTCGVVLGSVGQQPVCFRVGAGPCWWVSVADPAPRPQAPPPRCC